MGDTEQVQVAAPEQQVKSKKGSGDLIFDIAHEIESYTKTKALNAAEKLAEDIEANYFKLGGVLKVILQQQWYEGYPTFEVFVREKFGFKDRKANYLMLIYTSLVDNQIPWEKVSHLGWTKLKDLAPILTKENVDEWVAKADSLTVLELQALLKASKEGEDVDGEKTAKTSTDMVKIAFKLHADQAELVQSALAKAKGELGSDHDNVALAGICSGYLANASGVQIAGSLQDQFKALGLEAVLSAFEQVFPNVDLEVTVKEEAAA
jgi:hypothetical protein